MRLIDADALLKQLLEAKDDEIIKAVIGLVQTQPTAYDVLRVVAELDKASFLMPPREKGHYADNGLFLEDAIDIVRKGGVNAI